MNKLFTISGFEIEDNLMSIFIEPNEFTSEEVFVTVTAFEKYLKSREFLYVETNDSFFGTLVTKAQNLSIDEYFYIVDREDICNDLYDFLYEVHYNLL
jgi:hypothetical protein